MKKRMLELLDPALHCSPTPVPLLTETHLLLIVSLEIGRPKLCDD